MRDLFAVALISYPLNVRKDEPLFYDLVITAAQCPPPETLFVGDRVDCDVTAPMRPGCGRASPGRPAAGRAAAGRRAARAARPGAAGAGADSGSRAGGHRASRRRTRCLRGPAITMWWSARGEAACGEMRKEKAFAAGFPQKPLAIGAQGAPSTARLAAVPLLEPA